MRRRLVASWWRRVGLVLAVLVLAGPLMAGEVVHFLWWGHIGIGLHTDLVAWGDPESRVGYQIWAANLTPLPLPLRFCAGISDTGQVSFRRKIEQWTPRSRSWHTVETSDPCGTFPSEHIGWLILWPGARAQLVDWAPYGLPFRSGDRARISIFTQFDRSDDDWLQLRLVSNEFVVPVDTGHAR